jgi:hypothetical protein
MKTSKIELEEQIKESAEAIMVNRWGWTLFTDWAKGRFNCGSSKANNLWNWSWEHIYKVTEDGIKYNKDAAFIELENLKQIALEQNDRRTFLEAVKYQGKINNLETSQPMVNITGDNIKLSWGNEK